MFTIDARDDCVWLGLFNDFFEDTGVVKSRFRVASMISSISCSSDFTGFGFDMNDERGLWSLLCLPKGNLGEAADRCIVDLSILA